jgi:hypothetical protein
MKTCPSTQRWLVAAGNHPSRHRITNHARPAQSVVQGATTPARPSSWGGPAGGRDER